MTVRNPYLSSRPAQAQTAGAADASRVRSADGPVSPVAPVAPAASASDSVQLSDAARAQQAEAAAQKAEVEQARAALNDLPGLSDDRVAELRQRVEEGYYDRPDVIAATAERVAQALTGETSL